MIRLATNTAIVLATLLALYVAWEFRYAITLFLLSLALAAAVRPLIDTLARSGLPRFVGVTGTFLAGGVVLLVLVLIVGNLLLKDLERAGRDYVDLLEHVTLEWPRGNALQQAVAGQIPPPERIVAVLTGDQAAPLIQAILGTAFSVLGSLVDLLVILVLAIYWTMDRVHFERLWLSLLPVERRVVGREMWRAVETETGAYFRSEGVQGLVGGGLLGIGYWILGFPYPTLLAVVASLAGLIPWVGAVFSLLGLMVLAPPLMLMMSPVAAAVTFLAVGTYTAAILLFLEIVVEPRFFNRWRYNSLLMVLGVIALADQFGILGLLLGPPLAVALQVLSEDLLRRWKQAPAETSTPPLVVIEERLGKLKAQVAALREPPPELTTILDRLSALAAQAHHVLPDDRDPKS